MLRIQKWNFEYQNFTWELSFFLAWTLNIIGSSMLVSHPNPLDRRKWVSIKFQIWKHIFTEEDHYTFNINCSYKQTWSSVSWVHYFVRVCVLNFFSPNESCTIILKVSVDSPLSWVRNQCWVTEAAWENLEPRDVCFLGTSFMVWVLWASRSNPVMIFPFGRFILPQGAPHMFWAQCKPTRLKHGAHRPVWGTHSPEESSYVPPRIGDTVEWSNTALRGRQVILKIRMSLLRPGTCQKMFLSLAEGISKNNEFQLLELI